MRPLIGLVSGTYNRLKLLKDMVQSFRDNLPPGIPYTITLVDGGSNDGTIEWCKEQADIKLIEHGKLKGAIRAFTDGAFATDAKYILLANDDITFPPHTIMRAFTYLDEHSRCGAVAFQDNRRINSTLNEQVFKTLKMPAVVRDQPGQVIYAQVGLFRKWLGDTIGWWGADDVMRNARTYGGDNHLSAHIWQRGYRVEETPGCYIIDHVIDDELRQINRAAGKVAAVDDSNEYYKQWSNRVFGPIVPPAPTLPQQDSASVRVLYLPIFEPGWPVQKIQKRGLRDALQRATTPNGFSITVYEVDYMGIQPNRLEDTLLNAADVFKPHLILTQIQAPQPLNKDILAKLRSLHPRATLVNWNGDESQGGLVSGAMLALLKHVDLQLTVNASTLDVYRSHGIKADYWQIGYETPEVMSEVPFMPKHDVVFLGSFANPARLPLLEALKKLSDEGINVGVYSPGDASNTLYDFLKGRSLYHQAKIAVGSNEYQDSYGFFSNRVIEAMAAGGAMLLQQTIPGIEPLTGIIPGTHFAEWIDYEDFNYWVHYYLDYEEDRRHIADAGTAFIREYHSFDHRVKELFTLMKRHLGEGETPDGNAVYLRYIGPADYEFGIGQGETASGLSYIYKPGQPLLVDRFDCARLIATGNWELLNS